MEPNDTITCLSAYGIKPSVQRMAVLDYLRMHRTHPTADEIYSALVRDMPTLSKTTVYNTLRLLVESGAVRQLSLDEHGASFDADLRPHAHFLCRCCGAVVDLPCTGTCGLEGVNLPEGFVCEQSNVTLRGLCAACAGTIVAES